MGILWDGNTMPKNTALIIISGLPCSGKTTLAKKIAEEFMLPFVSRDDIKERIFDDLGYRNREWSRKIGTTSYTLLYYFAESMLKAGASLLLESNFNPKFDSLRFEDLAAKYEFTPLQIYCKSDRAVLFERFKKRATSPERHPGHVDHLNFGEFKDTLSKSDDQALTISGQTISVDTTDFAAINYTLIADAIRSLL